jgi:hypothetical protein
MKTQKDLVVANIECSDIIEDEVKKYGEKELNFNPPPPYDGRRPTTTTDDDHDDYDGRVEF